MSTALHKALLKLGYLAEINEGRPRDEGYNINTRGRGKTERFQIDSAPNIDLVPLDTRPDEEAVLIMVKDNDAAHGKQNIAKMLLGHDERQLYVAAVPRNVKTVAEAKDRLKPGLVIAAERAAGVKTSKKNKHRNEARIRQGDFFFVPTTDEIDERMIKKNQPLRRGGGNAHMLAEVVEVGGQAGYERFGQFISVRQYELLPADKRLQYRQTRRNPTLYARGKVRHAEHKTIYLKGWHQVVPNTEAGARDIRGRAVLGRIAFTD
jgi:hypothetical protein